VTDPHKWVIHGERLVDDTPHIRVSLADVELPNHVRFTQYVFRMRRCGIEFVMSSQPVIGNADYPQDLYVAHGAEHVGEPEVDETAEVRWVPVDETPAMIAKGDILGAITIIGVQHALLRRAAARVPPQ
jgi:hypothetical protein